METIFVVLIIITGILAIIITAYLYNHKLQKLHVQLDEVTSHGKEIQLTANMYKGEVTQILGSFILLDEYTHLSVIGSVSTSASFVLIGLKENELHFIEIKSPGAGLSTMDNKVKKIIEDGKVFYRIIEVGIPSEFVIQDQISGKKKD